MTLGYSPSKGVECETPQDFFDELNEQFVFDLDPCATIENAKCKTFFTKEQDGLKRSWGGYRVFMNPPYGREIVKWVKKAYDESRHATIIVGLLPARTDTRWFHDWVYPYCEIRFLKGRLKFNGANTGAPFPSMVVIWKWRFEE